MTPHIQSLVGEVWKPVVGHETRYLISNMGRVYSLNGGMRYRYKGVLLKPSSAKGYLRIKLHRPVKEGRIHQMVLEAFVGPRPEGMDACHNDGNSLNNRLDNLRWASPKENMADAKKHGTACEGTRHYSAKFTENEVKYLRQRFPLSGLTYREFAATIGVSPNPVFRMLTRRSYKNVL